MAKKKSLINDLINMNYNDFVQLTKAENIESLKSVVKSMMTQANRRITALNKSTIGKYSPALMSLNKIKPSKKTNIKSLMKTDKNGLIKFDSKSLSSKTTKDINELTHAYSKLSKFLKAKSSTIGGWQKIRSDIAERTGAKKLFQSEYKSKRSATIWHNREARFWKLYNRLVDNYGGIITDLDSDRIQKMLMKVQTMRNQGKTDDDISEIMNYYINRIYMDREFDDKQFLEDIKTESYMDEIRIWYGGIE